jgi:penicillin-binding protein 1C
MRQRAPTLLLTCMLLGISLGWGSALIFPAVVLPSFQDVRAAYRPSDVQLLDRHGMVLHELRLEKRGRRFPWSPLSAISPALQAAVIASEDRRFYGHGGVDGRALCAAALLWLTSGARRGASTISMQLVGLLDPEVSHDSKPRTLAQKWRQMRLAWALERTWSKAEILEAYLNLVTFRGELQGTTAAAAILFGKAPHGITELEAAILAVLVRAPNASPSAVIQRTLALASGQEQPMLQDAVTATVIRALETSANRGPRATLALHAAHRLLRVAPASGPVTSTLDVELQRVATESLRQHLMAVRGQRVSDGAILVVDNASGEVLAYVAGSAELSSARYVDGIQARRQPGSALKPFLYGMALEQRLLTPASLLEDTPLDLSVVGGLYRPRNYDERFRGLVTLRTALAASLNIPAVRTLELVGAEAFVQQLRRLGFAGVVQSGEYYGPSLALGSVEVSLWELVNAYRTLANGGVWRPLRMTPEDPDRAPSHRVYSVETAFLLSQLLADRESRSPTFGLENPLGTRFWSAVKTGTSKEMRDNWCIGFTQRYTVGVWVGNLSGEPMRQVSGITGAAPIWLEVLSWLHRVGPSGPLLPPAGVLARPITFSGDIEPGRVEWFLAGTEPEVPGSHLPEAFARILAPVSGSVIVLDPDIPPAQQRVIFEGDGGGPDLRWVLDGKDVGPASAPLIWEPLPGGHTLSLVDGERRALDIVAFIVRGATPRPPP